MSKVKKPIVPKEGHFYLINFKEGPECNHFSGIGECLSSKPSEIIDGMPIYHFRLKEDNYGFGDFASCDIMGKVNDKRRN